MAYFLSNHTIIMQPSVDRILIYHVHSKKGLIAENSALGIIEAFLTNNILPTKFINFIDASTFSLSHCLLDNPSGIKENIAHKLENQSAEIFINKLKSLDLLVENNDYLLKQGKKEGLFDQHHYGNFHQQIGHFMLNLREDPEMWWIEQKFNLKSNQPNDNPYSWVQLTFMKDFFSSSLNNQTWLDFGCGIGYYTQFFSQRGAKITGIDPSKKYIEIANKNFSNEGKVQYIQQEFESNEDFKRLKTAEYDCIFMSDVFMYYFEPYKKMDISAHELLIHLKKLLKPKGKIYIMDPHGCFHLQPWFGEQQPYLICSEYKNRKYRVTPNLQEMSSAFEKAGLVINKIRELTHPLHDVELKNTNKQANSEFPLWWFFELSVAL